MKLKHCFSRFLLCFCTSVFAFTSLAKTNDVKTGTAKSATFDLGGVQVVLPRGVTPTKHDGPDFTLYYFQKTKEKRQVLFAYVGFHPSFPLEAPKSLKEQRTRINGKLARTYRWKDKAGRLSRETLVDMTLLVHFTYKGLTQNEAKIADGIIATVRPTPPTAKP